jgi:hypothetical protein
MIANATVNWLRSRLDERTDPKDGSEAKSPRISGRKLIHGLGITLRPTAISPSTMLVELQVDNFKNEILPGSYATIRVPTTVLGRMVILPDSTLIFRGTSLQVAVVDANSVVQLRDVKVGRDFGTQSEVLSGVAESDKVIVNPSDSLTTGTTVRVAAATPTASPSPAVPKK